MGTLTIFKGAYGTDHPHTKLCQRKLADVRADLEFPLHAATKRGDVDAMTQLLDEGAEVNQVTESGETPLVLACAKGHVDVVRLLLDRGADVHRSNSDGMTPLLIACYAGLIEIVQLL